MLDMTRAREIFEASEDFTVGIEEEFGILDPETRELVPRFVELRDAAQSDPLLAESVAGELIESEIEITLRPRRRLRRRGGAPARAPRAPVRPGRRARARCCRPPPRTRGARGRTRR